MDSDYGAEGLRINKTVIGEKTDFIWAGEQLVLALSEGGKVKKRYVRGNDLVFAGEGDNTEKQYNVIDPYGNVVQLSMKVKRLPRVRSMILLVMK